MCCLICQQEVNGPGLTIQGISICANCEGDIVGLDVNDPGYDQFLEWIKRIWSSILSGEEKK